MNILKRILIGFRISDTKKSFPKQDHYCISYHDPRSITWSWILYWTPPWRARNATNATSFHHRAFGYFHFSRQLKMMKGELK